ncbi:hypothetical protein OBBRIDRAFT_551085 [Obba rivulosa]|uniref:Uncharacterized protein n=1 Tax=Obba rivulosa TaxID=1052685 RepID=A0A8E2AVE4_9APHY|nr:hypothetical protein OBBRIDRAFT_551085 [Obba rivulosa]
MSLGVVTAFAFRLDSAECEYIPNVSNAICTKYSIPRLEPRPMLPYRPYAPWYCVGLARRSTLVTHSVQVRFEWVLI